MCVSVNIYYFKSPFCLLEYKWGSNSKTDNQEIHVHVLTLALNLTITLALTLVLTLCGCPLCYSSHTNVNISFFSDDNCLRIFFDFLPKLKLFNYQSSHIIFQGQIWTGTFSKLSSLRVPLDDESVSLSDKKRYPISGYPMIKGRIQTQTHITLIWWWWPYVYWPCTVSKCELITYQPMKVEIDLMLQNSTMQMEMTMKKMNHPKMKRSLEKTNMVN